MNKTNILLVLLLQIVGVVFSQSSINVGSTVQTVTLRDGNDIAKAIPFIGEKIITIFYTDPDVKDVNDALSNAIKARNYSPAKHQGIGIGSCADTWLPNAAIRMKARQKEQQFAGSVILLDTDYTLKKNWGFKETDDAGIIIIVGLDKKIKYFKTIKTEEESKSIINEVLKILDGELLR